MSRRESVGRMGARRQSSAAPPQMETVRVAVLPPRLPPGMAPPTGVGAAGVFSWDEAINWQHNDKLDPEGAPRKKSFLQKAGFTTQRERKGEKSGLPPFTMREVPYDTWRKHYAKDAEGNYRGTHAPAEDCLLKPHDVAAWRLEEPKTKGDQWTRGADVLPVYDEVTAEGQAPGYDDTNFHSPQPEQTRTSGQQLSTSLAPAGTSPVLINGKTAQQIIEEAKANSKEKQKPTFKTMLKRGAEYTMMGS